MLVDFEIIGPLQEVRRKRVSLPMIYERVTINLLGLKACSNQLAKLWLI